VRNNSSGTSGSASSPSSGVSSQLTSGHPQQQQQHTSNQQNNSLAAQLVSQQLLMQNALGALAPQDIQALASTLQQHQQSLQQQLHQYAMFQQANSTTANGQLPPHFPQFFLQNQVSIHARMEPFAKQQRDLHLQASSVRSDDQITVKLSTCSMSRITIRNGAISSAGPAGSKSSDVPTALSDRPRIGRERTSYSSLRLLSLSPSTPPLTPSFSLGLSLSRARDSTSR